MYPPPPCMVHPLEYRFAQPLLHAPAPVPAPIHPPLWLFSPPSGFGSVPTHAPLASRMVVPRPLRVIVPIFHYHQPHPPPSSEQHPVAPIATPISHVPDLEEDYESARDDEDHMAVDDDNDPIAANDGNDEDHIAADDGRDDDVPFCG